MRARLGAPPGATLVLALGRLVEKKGFAYLVDAAARVPGVHVALAGEGDLRTELAARTATASAPVRLVGALDRASVAAALAAADIVVVPSVVDRAGNVDGLPNVLLEAMAAGRAVIASRVAGIPDVVTDGVDGILVEEKDVAGLAAALARLAARSRAAAAAGGGGAGHGHPPPELGRRRRAHSRRAMPRRRRWTPVRGTALRVENPIERLLVAALDAPGRAAPRPRRRAPSTCRRCATCWCCASTASATC